MTIDEYYSNFILFIIIVLLLPVPLNH